MKNDIVKRIKKSKNVLNFSNDCGENYYILYNSLNFTQIVTGSELDFSLHPIFKNSYSAQNGLFGTFSDNEKQKISEELDKIDYLKDISIYKKINTIFKIGKNYCFLKNNICPCCLEIYTTGIDHHTTESSHGGSNDNHNRLLICERCHESIHNYNNLEKRAAVYWHQIMYFGMNYFIREKFEKGNHPEEDPWKEKAVQIEFYKKSNEEIKQKMNSAVKEKAIYLYQFYRDLAFQNFYWTKDIGKLEFETVWM